MEIEFCRHRGTLHATGKSHPDVYSCRERSFCTIQPSGLRLMSGEPMPTCDGCQMRNIIVIKQPVGDKLAEIIAECGVEEPEGCSCKPFQAAMNRWGVEGCQVNEAAIIEHLNDAADKVGWLDWIKIRRRGFTGAKSLLAEAIKRSTL